MQVQGPFKRQALSHPPCGPLAHQVPYHIVLHLLSWNSSGSPGSSSCQLEVWGLPEPCNFQCSHLPNKNHLNYTPNTGIISNNARSLTSLTSPLIMFLWLRIHLSHGFLLSSFTGKSLYWAAMVLGSESWSLILCSMGHKNQPMPIIFGPPIVSGMLELQA